MKYQVNFFKGGELFSSEILTYKNDFHLISCYILENLKDVIYINKELVLRYNNGNILKFKRAK